MALLEAVANAFQTLGAGVQGVGRMTLGNSLAVAQAEPSKYELTKAGRRFSLGISAAITGIAPVTALPTTAAAWALYNTSATKSIYIEKLGMLCSSGTPGVGGSMIACQFTIPVTTGVLYTGLKIADMGASGGVSASNGVVQASVTISSPAAPAWFAVAMNNNANVGAFPGSGGMLQGEQGIILPPGAALGMSYLGLAGTTPLYVPQIEWVELG